MQEHTLLGGRVERGADGFVRTLLMRCSAGPGPRVWSAG